MGMGKFAVLLMNHAGASTPLTLTFSDIPGITGTSFKLRDINTHTDLGTVSSVWVCVGGWGWGLATCRGKRRKSTPCVR